MSGLVRAESLFRARRRARRRESARPMLVLAIVVTVAGALLWGAFSSPLLRLNSITVKGTSRLDAGQVLAAARVPTGGSLLRVPVGAIGRRVRELAPVASVTVSRQWPHGLLIDVTERVPVAAVVTGGGRTGTGDGAVLVDAHGVAFATVASTPPGLLDLRVDPPALGGSSPAASAALRVWAELPSGVRKEVRWVAAASPDAVSFALARGATVVWGSPDDGADKLAVLAALTRQPASVYDVSTPSVAVTR